MDRRRRCAIFRVRRRATYGQRCRRCAAKDGPGTGRQIRRRSERLRREAQDRQTLQARRLLDRHLRAIELNRQRMIKLSLFSLALIAQVASAGLEKYSSLVVADKYPFTQP